MRFCHRVAFILGCRHCVLVYKLFIMIRDDGEAAHLRASPIQIIGDVRYLASRNHKRVGDNKDTPRTAYHVSQHIFSSIGLSLGNCTYL